MDMMNIELLDIIEAIEDTIGRGKSMPLVGKILIDKDELLSLVDEMRMALPDDIKKAKYISEERSRLVKEARNEAAMIVSEAEEKAAQLVEQDVITQQAIQKAEEILESAKEQAKNMRLGAKEYAGSVLDELNKLIEFYSGEIKQNKAEIENML